jgi:PAS domain S-box-containing protein/putative nucleotidyltransferase with HDIG domain
MSQRVSGKRQLENILDSLLEGFQIIGFDWRYLYVNDAAAKHGHTIKEKLLGKTMMETYPGIEKTHMFSMLRKCKEERTSALLENEFTFPDGSKGWFELRMEPVPDGISILSVEITERKKELEKIKEISERYRTLFDRSMDCVYLHNLEGRFIDANRAALNLLGYTIEEITSLNFASLLSPDQIPKALRVMEEIKNVGFQKDVSEFRLRNKNGEDRYVETNSSLFYHEGKPYAIQGIARDITQRKETEKELYRTLEILRKTHGATIQAINRIVENRDPYTAGHQIRVADLSRAIATEMGLSRDSRDGIRIAAQLHDLGKLSVPSEILSKPGKLTEDEFRLIKEHPKVAYEILSNIEFPWPVADIILQHHERMNGSGYPQGLSGDDILIEARILGVADVVEAMVSHRPYRPARKLEDALNEISQKSGVLYDPKVAEVCLKLFKEKNYHFRA